MREEKKYSKGSFETIGLTPNEIKLGCKFNLLNAQ